MKRDGDIHYIEPRCTFCPSQEDLEEIGDDNICAECLAKLKYLIDNVPAIPLKKKVKVSSKQTKIDVPTHYTKSS
jgi:hypothetical protein